MYLHLKMHANIKPYLASLLIKLCLPSRVEYLYAFLDAGTCISSDTYHISLVI